MPAQATETSYKTIYHLQPLSSLLLASRINPLCLRLQQSCFNKTLNHDVNDAAELSGDFIIPKPVRSQPYPESDFEYHLGSPAMAMDSPRLCSTFTDGSSSRYLVKGASAISSGKVRSYQSRGCAVTAEIRFVDPPAAKKLVSEEGYSIVDVRDRSQYDRAHIPSASHIPLFIENTDSDINSSINRALHNGFSGLFYGVAFTKPNPAFLEEVGNKFSKDSKLLLVCQEGLRSGKAAEALERAGFQNLAQIDGGLQKVEPGTFPKEGPKELQDAGKAGLVTVQGKISTVLGSVLIAAYLFLKLFPTQAEELFFKR